MRIPHYVKHINSCTHCRGRISIISTLFPQSLLSLSLSFTLSLQHMPTHAAAQAHVIWNCIFPSFSLLSLVHTTLSLSPLSVSHMHTCACTPRTRFPFELNWQLSPPLLLSLFLHSLCNSNQEHTLLSRQGWNLCSPNRALCHHLRFTNDTDVNRWPETKKTLNGSKISAYCTY